MKINSFKTDLANATIAAIRKIKREDDGTVGIGVDCLFAHVKIPASAPKGTNALYYIKQDFREVCEQTPEIARFIC